MTPVIGTVITQDAKIHAMPLQFTDFTSPLQMPTAAVAPTMHCVVETGSASCDARTTAMER